MHRCAREVNIVQCNSGCNYLLPLKQTNFNNNANRAADFLKYLPTCFSNTLCLEKPLYKDIIGHLCLCLGGILVKLEQTFLLYASKQLDNVAINWSKTLICLTFISKPFFFKITDRKVASDENDKLQYGRRKKRNLTTGGHRWLDGQQFTNHDGVKKVFTSREWQ